MPNTTAVPSDTRLAAPAPVANIIGITPNTNARAVMSIGRRRTLPASSAACRTGMPFLRKSMAYSTMRIAFLAAIPSSSIMPIWVYMLILLFINMQPRTTPRIAVGVVMTTATGSVHDSYWAANTRMVIITANMSIVVMVVPDCVS